MRAPRALAAVLAVLTATGWAANHFSALIPVYAAREHLSTTLLDGVFGLYAVGLLPGLFLGGALSDRLGRPRVVLPGATLAAVGTLVLLLDHGPPGLLAGRLVVGLGAGLTFGAGTAWAADLGGASGTVLAGVFLTGGFGVGPFVSGVLATVLPGPLTLPYAVSLAASAAAVSAALAVAVVAAAPVTPPGTAPSTSPAMAPATPVAHRPPAPARVPRSGAALAWAAPVGVLVFACATTAIVPLPARLPERYDGPLLVGVACLLTLGTGIVVQAAARRLAAGPRTGVLGAGCAAAGLGLAAAGGRTLGLPLFAACCLLLGAAYGLCLREGLLDVETLAPPERRGLLIGVYYVVTYLGFGLPLLLVALTPAYGEVAPLVVLAGVAAALGLVRSLQLGRGHPAR